jgi:NADH-quinone oxidoreductase subunit H
MNLGWKILIPLALANIVLTGVITVIYDTYFK